MYLEYFGLTEKPFQITPDPRFLYLSRRHRDGFAHLLYGADEAGGFVLLTGEVGTGKTTLCRSALESITDNVRIALILNPKQSPVELVASICDELQVSYPKNVSSIKALIDRLNLYLLKAYGQGQRIVVVIDEAQNLTSEVLEQVRLLTNLEVSTQKLLQIILIGQPELQTMLDMPELRQLSQRITARFHLTPLTREETGEYITHRLKIAGVTREVFTKSAVSEIYKLSRGIPRLVNTLCERALIGAYGANLPLIKKDIVSNAATEVLGKSTSHRKLSLSWPVIGGVSVALLAIAIGLWSLILPDKPPLNNAQANVEAEIIDKKLSSPVAEVAPVATAIVEPEPVMRKQDFPVQSKFASLLLSQSGNADTFSAFTNLFALWQRDYSAYTGDTACTRAIKAGMRCIFGRGVIADIIQYNRPAVLELKNANQKIIFVLLYKANGNNLSIKINDKEVDVRAEELQQTWSGNYIVLWKPPFPDNESLAEGFVGPDVLWLRHQLDGIEGKQQAEYSADNLKFNSELAERVTQFQASRGLKADGIVGRETFIELINVSGTSVVPKLKPTNKG
ncbi:MAG: AAA family ATPase [Gammaproteobacteria bacterium]|nr:AAA family ATPase [Gammaproteobacteria bacterium]